MSSDAPRPADSPAESPHPLAFNFPRREQEMRERMVRFAEPLAADPARYHVEPKVAAETLRLVREYLEADLRRRSPNSNPTIAVAEKTQAKIFARSAVLALARTIKADPRVSTADKLELGFEVPIPGQAALRRRPPTFYGGRH